MLQKILDNIRANDMLGDSRTVLCGLSGGADSVCLLLAIKELSATLGIEVRALHVNHNLRGAESDRDEDFCRSLCEELGVPFTAVSCDVSGYAKEHSLSTEEAARKLRYQAFDDNSSGMRIATAHNANDNLETMILNLVRGTALKGIAGIPPVRGSYIRPLLTVTRAEIEDFLRERGQDYVTDSTNLSDDYTRNKIRHRIIPLMQEINPSVVTTSVRSASAMRDEERFIENAVSSALAECRDGNALNGLSAYPNVIRRRCIARLLADNALPYSSDRLAAADGILLSGGRINVSGDLFLEAYDGSIELRELHRTAVPDEVSIPLSIGENRIYDDCLLICELIECDELTKYESVHKKLTFKLLDYDKIVGKARVRSRRFGDRIRLAGRDFTSSVKKIINEKIPGSKRSRLHFIEDDEGLIYAEDIGIAARVVPDSSTKRLLAVYACTDTEPEAPV